MSYIPHTDIERQQMLAAIGVTTIEDLFDAVPSRHRFPALDLPEPAAEMDVSAELQALAEANDHAGDFSLFRGAGAYHHYVPAAVDHMLLRGEFYTAYTPYQPEMSQGTLQAIFEYQTMIAQLTGMDGANASHYDGATSLAEAVIVALETSRRARKKIILSKGIHPQYRAVTRTYHQWNDLAIVGDDADHDFDALGDLIDGDTAMVAIAYPDYYGRVIDFRALAAKVHAAGALLCVVANPMALALFKSPGELGADIVVGEGQPLGIPLSYGGPYVGFFATKMANMRRIAGRIVGETVDKHGTKAYVMTLRPREQDIRRERASSNICTNQGLMALAATVYLSLMGKAGMKQAAALCYHRAHYAAARIAALDGYSVDTTAPFFHEFVVKCPRPVADINATLYDAGIIGGIDLGADDPTLTDHMLLCVTEMNRKDEIDTLVQVMSEAAR
ncbi:MAG: aminomethyl-transferring glycine dehydrogenase subunit GcvPA [Chloroflexota bacterium]|nr:aminomethyl-transferring glycine dehydrogenase subunit GcvPA [Chloroflexota bacterium]